MISQENNYSNPAHADYSAVRSRVENQRRGFDVADDEVTLSSGKECNSMGNQNISSVLSQIKDDGPANSTSTSKDSVVDFRKNKPGSFEGKQRNQLNEAYSQLQGMQQGKVRAELPVKNTGNITWLQLFLFSAVVLAAMYYMFRLDARTNQLEQSLSYFETGTQGSSVTNQNQPSTDLASINETLLIVKNDIEKIKTQNVIAENEFEQPEAGGTINLFEDVKANEDVKILKEEISSLREKLESANTELAENKALTKTVPPVTSEVKTKSKAAASKKAIKKPLDKEIIISKQVVTSGWIVNLASFTSKDRTQGKVEQLLSLGYTPLIEEAVVNGKKVYRLIVDGFEERAQAELFVQIVAEQFGMKGGWIRKSA